MIQSLLARRRVRRIAVGSLVVTVFVALGLAYRAYKTWATHRLAATVVEQLKANVIGPNALIAGEPFSFGMKPEWWHGQWLIVPTATPARKAIALRAYLKQGWLQPYVPKIEIGCMAHDPRASKELDAYGVEERFDEVRIKAIPPSVLLGGRRVDFRHWFPGSFEVAASKPADTSTADHDPDLGEPFERTGDGPVDSP